MGLQPTDCTTAAGPSLIHPCPLSPRLPSVISVRLQRHLHMHHEFLFVSSSVGFIKFTCAAIWMRKRALKQRRPSQGLPTGDHLRPCSAESTLFMTASPSFASFLLAAIRLNDGLPAAPGLGQKRLSNGRTWRSAYATWAMPEPSHPPSE
jgi:hypothetical protein